LSFGLASLRVIFLQSGAGHWRKKGNRPPRRNATGGLLFPQNSANMDQLHFSISKFQLFGFSEQAAALGRFGEFPRSSCEVKFSGAGTRC
jgi:hypothetical protein